MNLNNVALPNYNQLKLLPVEKWWDMIPPDFEFITKPWDHQVLATACMMGNDSFLQACDMGTGKTKIIIDGLRFYRQMYQRPLRGLVVCLNSAVENWVDEFNMHGPEFTKAAVRASCRADKKEILGPYPADVKIIHFEGLRSLCCTRKAEIGKRTPKGKQKTKEVIDLKYIRALLASTRWDFVVIDESHKVKNYKAKIYGVLKHLSQRLQHRYLLTGTPFHNLLDVWAQYWLMDRGDLFGSSFWSFKQTFFEPVEKYFYGNAITEWKITDQGRKDIERLMWSRAIRFAEDECNSLPEKVFIKKEYTLTQEQKRLYKEVTEGSDEGKSNMKRQICSGFLYKQNKVLKKNPKLELLADLLGVMVERDKVVIFHEFIEECNMIEDLLKRARIDFVSLNGRQKSNAQNAKDFQNLPKIRVCIAHPKSGGQSINLHRARYCINFSNGHSIIDWKQKIKRIHRGEIKRKRIYYDLVGKNTCEVGLYWALKNNIDIFDSIMNGEFSFTDFDQGKIPEAA